MTEHRDTGDLFAKGHRAKPKAARGAPAAHAVPPGDAAGTPSSSREGSARPGAAEAASTAGTLGARLRGARAAKQLTLADCARALHLPAKVLQRLEADDLGEADDFVFQRGALKGYAQLLGLPPGSWEESLRAVAPATQPALVAVARTSRTHWLLQRYGTAATYIVLTAMIAVPLVLLGLRGGLQRPDARIVSLDQPATSDTAPHAGATTQRPLAPAPDPAAAADTTPFRASLAPFSAMGFGDDATTTAPAVAGSSAAPSPVPAQADGQHTLTVAANTDCWYEIADSQGNKIDSGMLHAGDTRTWHSAGPLHVTLGNAGGVTVTEDGRPFPLQPSQRANVARFDLFEPVGASEHD